VVINQEKYKYGCKRAEYYQTQARAREMYEPLELGSARLRFKKTKIIIKMTQFFQNIKLVNIQTIKMATTIKSSMS